ncbi:MAG: AraC family transcriptional regulator [Saccharofermentans sp.]|nr:AraC family transcriptional regulator [Saccharofermentans sp.]
MNVEQMGLIIKRDDGSEVVNYDNPSFPSYIYDGWIEPNCTWERVPHYHEDLEIVTVREGTMAYSVNGRTLVLREGDTIIVNSNQIHYSMSLDGQLAKYVIFVVHPSILMSSVTVEMEAIRPIIDNPDLPFMRFRYINTYTKDFYNLMIDLPDYRHNAFEVTKRLFLMWDLIMKKTEDYGPRPEDTNHDPRMMSFKTMLHFMNVNYKESITLEQIASVGNVSKSQCNNLFNQFVGESPINYLMHLRARKVAEHLRSGNYTLKQIADITGFNGVSYMSETFKKIFGQSPRDYKKQWLGIVPEPADE